MWWVETAAAPRSIKTRGEFEVSFMCALLQFNFCALLRIKANSADPQKLSYKSRWCALIAPRHDQMHSVSCVWCLIIHDVEYIVCVY